jgi:hypothetical protein
MSGRGRVIGRRAGAGDSAAPAAEPRRGAVLVMAVACLAVVSLIATAMLEGAIHARRQWRLERVSRQLDCLLDAAESLARRRLAEGRPQRLSISLDLPAGAASPAASANGTGQVESNRPTVLLAFSPGADGAWRVEVAVEWRSGGADGPVARRSRVVWVAPDGPGAGPGGRLE